MKINKTKKIKKSIKQGFKEVKLQDKGKLPKKSLEDFLDEL